MDFLVLAVLTALRLREDVDGTQKAHTALGIADIEYAVIDERIWADDESTTIGAADLYGHHEGIP